MATCPNINLDSWKSLVSSRGEDIAYYLWDKYEGVVPKNEYEVSIKPGVEELFNENPELANQVYKSLGIIIPTNVKVKGKVLYAGKEYPNTFQITFQNNDNKYIGFAKINNQNINSIELQPEFRKQGLGTEIYVLLGEELAKNNITLESAYYTGSQLTQQAKATWESLVKKGYAIKTENNYKFVSKAEQKQQALQLYSQYLDSIFPDSQVKDIVYHASRLGVDRFEKFVSKDNEFYFSDNEEYNRIYTSGILYNLESATQEDIDETKKYIQSYSVLLNIKNPKILDLITYESVANNKNTENDALIGFESLFGKPSTIKDYVVFEPEQIHILGTQQDIEGFKNFVGGKTNVQYQLTSKEIKEADKKLDAKLLNFLSRYGVKSTEINNFKERFGVDAIGATDVLNKIIYHSVEKKLDTIPEEAAHMIVMLMGQTHPLIKDLMDNIKDWSGYQAVYDEYMPVYNNEKQVKVEALGKLVTESLLQKWTGKSKEERNLLTKILEAVTDFLNALTKPFVLKEGSYFKDAADKIAVNVLQENEAFIGSPKSKIERLNYEQALSGNKLAQNIINTYSGKRFGFKLVGSLAIAGQGEDIYRPSKAPIHDLDFIVENDDKETGLEKYNRLVDNMNQINAVPIHGGWENKQKEYTTYAYLIPKQGYKFSNIERNERDNLYKYTILDENDNVVANVKLVSPKVTVFTDKNGKVLSEEKINSLSQLHIPVDFFVYNVDSNKQSVDIFSSIQDIYFGKLSLSPLGTDERMFQREKDQEDYRTSNFNKRDIQKNEFIYLQEEPQSTKKADEEINTLVKNFLAKLGISVKSVDEIRDKDGNVISATAKADMLNKIIEIIEGKAGIDTLPEEAAHFFVEMLDENNPLLKEMMSKITGYKIYAETVEQYKNNSQYRNKDGTLNITKLKKEAIGKLIAQHIISQSTTNESDAKMKDFTSWWSKVWNFIKSLFKKSQVDAFKVAAEKILKSDTSDLSQQNIQDQGEFYQLEGIEKLEQHQTDIQLDNSIDPKTGQKRHIYNINGKDIKYSVTSKYVDAWLKRKFPNDNRSETQKKIDLLKADYGDIIHEMMQDIIDVYVDPKTHMVRNIPAASKNKNVDTKPYELFDKYIKDLIDNFNAPGTKFMREVKIYDPVKDVAGSIDLLIIEPNGTAHIYDWKSQEIAREQTELKPYKETMYRIQLQEYKKILQTHYDIKNFGYVRAIPIRVVYGYTGKGDTRTIDGVNKIEMGSFDLSDIPEHKNYLLPITLRDEKSDDKELSEYIKKLNSVMDILENKKYKTEDERRRKKVELSKYKNAVRDLQLKGDIRKFIELGNYEINKYKKMIKDETLTEKDALESLEILRVFTNTTNIFNNYMNELKKLKKETKEQELKDAIDELINDYNQMNSSADIVLESMHEAIKNIAVKFSKEKANIDNLLDAETEISKLTGMFSSLSTIPQKAFRVFSRILGDSQNKRDNQFKKDFEELSKLKDEYIDWARSQGYSNKDLFKPLLDYDGDNWTGKFLKKYRSEFYKKMQVAIQSEDIKWLIDNTEFNQEKFNKDKERQKKFYSTLVFDTKDKNNNEKLQQQAYDNWLLKHDVNIGGIHMNKEAYLNMDNYNGKKVLNSYLKPKATWYTEQWKKLESSPAALKTYNYFQDLLKRSNKAGVIDEYSPAFIPNISRNKLEQFVFGGDMFSSKGIFEKLEVESGESPFAPQINPITGAIEHSIPTHFVRDIGVEKEDGTMDYSQKSVDLFRVFGIWAAQLANYESMSEIEDKARLLLFVEKNKSHIETNQFNKPVLEGGIKKEIPGNEINSQLLSDFINYYFYNIQSGKIEDKVIKLGDKEYSSHKVLGWLTRFFSLKTLALNPLSGTANFVGGTGNAFFQASKGILFNTSDWASSIYDVTRRNEIALGLLGAADALLEDKTQGMINKLSVSSVIAANTIDKAYVMMHTSDKAVQYPIAIALMKNHMVDENGKIVDIKAYVKAKYKYNESFYSLPASEQTIIRKKIEDEVTTLKETKSIYTTAKIVNDKIEIPGVDLQSEQWGRFRLKIKKVSKNVLGNSTRDDINSIRTGMLGSMAMQFRSWMPQMVQERFGKLKYDQDLEVHTMGKFNLFFQEMFTKRSVALLTAIVNASGTSMIEAAKQKYLLLKAEAIEKGEEFTITEGEFVDMYIGNIRSLYKEFLMILGIGALMFTMLSGDDDDDENKGWRAYAARAFRKYYDEFAFFYFPTSWSNLVNTPIPAVGLAEDFFRFTGALTKQGYGFVTNDDDKMDDAKPAKYFSKMMPLFKEGIQIRAIFDDDFRKDWDIRFNTTNR